MSLRLSTLAMLAVVVWLVVELVVIWPALPDRIAIHFDFEGRPNGWSTRTEFVVTVGVLICLFVALFLSTMVLSRIPTRLVNLPNKDYWLAPERSAATFDTLSGWMQWFLVLVLGFVAAILVAALRANLSPEPRLAINALVWGAVLVAAVIGMNGWLFWRFRRPGP
jgi:uncharacterized membrane protein